MTRVWLTRWEWACCGDAFEIGAEVDLGIRSRDSAELVADLGAEVAFTVDALESHHEEEYEDRVRGRIVTVHEVTHEVVEEKFSYTPFPRAQIARETVRIEPVPGTTRLHPVGGVALAVAGEDRTDEGRRRARLGWLVDLDEGRPDVEPLSDFRDSE